MSGADENDPLVRVVPSHSEHLHNTEHNSYSTEDMLLTWLACRSLISKTTQRQLEEAWTRVTGGLRLDHAAAQLPHSPFATAAAEIGGRLDQLSPVLQTLPKGRCKEVFLEGKERLGEPC